MDYVKLEEHLIVVIPEGLDITYQIFPEYSDDQAVICGWNEEGLSYLLVADEQPGGIDYPSYWSSLEDALKLMSSNSRIKVIKSGAYLSDDGLDIRYRIYRRTQQGEEELLVFHLLRNDAIAYWVIPTLVDASDIFIVNNQISKILKSAILTK